MSLAAHAIGPDELLKDEKLEHRAREISAELRCLVCQNQSIDDSDATLARDLRILVRERLQEGDSNEQVMDYVVSRYGEFVLLKPVFKLHTLALWLTPLVVLLLGAFGLYRMAKRRKQQTVQPLSKEEQAALDALLKK
ncbi:cytochrome c-type biogenesis protein [Microvirga sp. W0021]|uniref:Cytochrome c-type biogenesis protein n=2 Tax=Hohaiivirga grylli TaxID=3133970 RepID=A0ABV0BHJ3_9HYPH